MRLEDVIQELEARSPRFERLVNVCTHFFGKPRQAGSHQIFKMPWRGDPRVNLQRQKDGKPKPYQVKQVLDALRKLKATGPGGS